MKLRYITVGALLATAVLTGCEEQLNLYPEDTISPELYFSNEKELELWTNQFYSQFGTADGLSAQNADDNVDNALGDLMLGQRDPASENGWSWSQLRKINYYLQNSKNTTDEAARQHYDGVAYFMRAYFYFNKVKRYGDVPRYSQVIESVDEELLFKERDDRGLVMDSVLADLDRAIEMLPTTPSKARVTRWTALALKSRAALFEGTFRKYHGLADSEKYLQSAVAAGQEFINTSTYTLYNVGDEPYRDLFNSTDARTEEVILARVYSASANVMHGIQFTIINMKQGFTRRFMNHYLMEDGSRITSLPDYEELTFVEETANRDPRLAQTVLTPGYVQVGSNVVTRNRLVAATGYQPIKFVGDVAYDGANKSFSDWPLFRTAEVYLNFAEAKAELGTITQADLDISINRLRERAKMPPVSLIDANNNPDQLLASYYPNVTKGPQTGVLLEIRRERTIELVMEGFRQWDLIRWKEGKAFAEPFYGTYFPNLGRYDMDNDGVDDLVLWQGERESIAGGTSLEVGVDIHLSEGTSGYVVAYPTIRRSWNEGRDYLYPIPTDERVLTKGILSQNPGWEDSSGY